MSRDAYRKIVLSLVPRIISSLNRNEFSPTFGCFDKSHWFYKVVNFSCARFQEPSLTLALLYKNKFKGNTYFKNEKIKEWAIAGIKFLTKVQNKNGSFNEWYPNENSFVGTAFPIYSAAETYLMLKNEIDKKIQTSLIEMFRKAGNWLIKHDEKVSNQQAGAVAALYNIFLITNDKKYKRNCEKKLLVLEKTQSEEGWFPEYGGADFGYSFILLDFLGKYFKKSHDKKVLKLVRSCSEFLVHFLHSDGSIGGSYGSRNTEFIVPHGIEIFSKYDNNANYIGNIIAKNIQNIVNPLVMDDRFAFQYHTSYLQAFLDYKKQKIKAPNIEKEKFFEDSGLFVTNKNYYMVIGTKKGGVFRLFKGRKHIYDDSGFIGKIDNKLITNQCTNSSKLVKFDKNNLVINGKFKEIQNRIIVVDEIKDRSNEIDNLYLVPKFTPQYTPTSAFFSFDDILTNKTVDYTKKLPVIKRVINLVRK